MTDRMKMTSSLPSGNTAPIRYELSSGNDAPFLIEDTRAKETCYFREDKQGRIVVEDFMHLHTARPPKAKRTARNSKDLMYVVEDTQESSAKTRVMYVWPVQTDPAHVRQWVVQRAQEVGERTGRRIMFNMPSLLDNPW